jgi:uncharacterized BrkB/YihY/UPF0761 family membrane protein
VSDPGADDDAAPRPDSSTDKEAATTEPATGIPGLVNAVRDWADETQRRHTVFGFPYAVVKKYGDDEAGRHAALLTYYGFLSIFPLLLIAVWVVGELVSGNAELRARWIDAIVPEAFRETVSNAVTALPTTGVPLVIGVVAAFSTGMGIVFSAYQTVNHVAGVPHRLRLEFFPRYLRIIALLLILVVGAAGVGAMTVLTSSIVDVAYVSRPLAFLGTAVIMFLLLWAASALLLPHRARLSIIWPAALLGAATASFVLTFGAVLLVRFVTRSGPVYGSFATIAGLFALLYIVSQVMLYAAEIAIVRRRRLWPRALDTARPTDADRRALLLLAREQERLRSERIDARFDAEPT